MLSPSFVTTHWMSLLASSFVVYVLGLIVYRLTLHPLAKYPGPLLAKITDLDNLYHVLMWDRHINLMKCHEKYGSVYRYGPNRLSFNTSSALHSIHDFKANIRKAKYYHAFQTGTSSTFSLIDKTRHGQRRRVIAHAFSDRALKGVEEGFLDNIRSWCGRLGEMGGEDGKGLDMSQWCNYLTFDVMGSLAFGRSFNMITSSENHYVSHLMKQSATFAHYNGNMLWAFRRNLTSFLFPGISSDRDQFRAYAMKQANARMELGAEGTEVKDFFYYLIGAKDPETGEQFTMNELWGEANLIIVAGSDTTSTVMAGAFFYLTHNPRVLDIVKREVRTVFEGCDVEDLVSGPKLNACVYLRACLEESLRMVPPIPGPLPREVCSGGAEIDGEWIPQGVDVSVGIYSIHHNAEYFPDPYVFRPERWIVHGSTKGDGNSNEMYDGVEKEEFEVAQKAFCAFSLGSRGCIGKNMAYIEMMLAMSRVLFLFDIEAVGTLGEGEVRNGSVEYRLQDRLNVHNEGPLIRFVKCET